MPPEELLRAWIQEFGAIFFFQHEDQLYVYRRLKRREFRAITVIEDELERTEETCETCILWPQEFKIDFEGLAGTPEVLCAQILQASGSMDIQGTLEAYSQRIPQDVEGQMEATIDYVFGGGGNFARYQDWSHDQFFEAFSKAQWTLENILGIKMAAETKEPPPKKRRSLGDRPEEIFSRINNPNTATQADINSLPKDFGGEPMAARPMNEVVSKFNNTQRQIAIREAALRAAQGK